MADKIGLATRKYSCFAGLYDWARLVSNQRPLACEASALPLSYAPEGADCTSVLERHDPASNRASAASRASMGPAFDRVLSARLQRHAARPRGCAIGRAGFVPSVDVVARLRGASW